MGNSISNHRLTPHNISECFNLDGQFDMELYFLYRRNSAQHADMEVLPTIVDHCCQLASKEMEEDDKTRPFVQQNREIQYLKVRNLLGDLVQMTPLNSVWYLNYVSHPKPEVKKWAALFCRRFCMLYESFLELVEMDKDSNLFDR